MKKLIFFFALILSVGITKELNAQPPDPGGGTNPPCFPPPCIPIDGGLSWLLLAGTVYGGKKIYDMKQDKKGVE
jgi:hypothetical protein